MPAARVQGDSRIGGAFIEPFAFDPSQLFINNIQGAWYDPSDNATMFQDAAGLTPVTAVEQPVGLIFDKRLGPTARRNLLTYSEQFDTGWSYASVSISANATTAPDGSMTADKIVEDTAIGAGRSVYQQINVGTATWSAYVKSAGNSRWLRLQTGASNNSWFNPDTGLWGTVDSGVSASVVALPNGWYRVSLTGTAGAPTYMALGLATGNGNATYNGDGTSGIFVWGAQLEVGSTASTYQKITSGVGGEWTPGNHAYQSTAASRPVLRARYNLLTYSEQFSNAVWGKGNVTVVASAGVAPDGTNTASLVYPSSSGTNRTIYEAGPGTTAASTTSFYVKASGKSWVWVVGAIGSSTSGAYFNVSTGTKGFEFPGYTGTISSVGNGWYRVSVSNPSTAMNYAQLIITDADASNAVTANGTDGVLLWGAQLLTAADAAATGNAYQRIEGAATYATGGVFRPYLAFDGVDDSLGFTHGWTGSQAFSLFSAGKSELTPATSPQLRSFVSLGTSGARNGVDLGWGWTQTQYDFTVSGVLPITGTAANYPGNIIQTALYNGVFNYTYRENGTQNGTLVDTAALVLSSSALLGSRFGTLSQCRIYGLIVRGAASTNTEVAQTESWLNAKTGAY